MFGGNRGYFAFPQNQFNFGANPQNQFNFGANPQNQNHISFCSAQALNGFFNQPFSSGKSNRSIQLLNLNTNSIGDFNFFELMPRNFTITTNNGSRVFNVDILTDTSQVINDFHKDNPNHFKYHLDINDEGNVLSKFEQMYQGKIVHFEEKDIPIYQKITEMLKITRCPNYKQSSELPNLNPNPNVFNFNFNFSDNITSGTKISENSFYCYLKNEAPKSFTISTKKKNYQCTNFGILSSSTLYDLITKDPTLNRYDYDFEDEFDEFQLICNFFNFQLISITPDNMNVLKEIADDLQIKPILKLVDKVISDVNIINDKIDEQQSISDSIDELFEWLHNIKEKTVESVAASIIESSWIKSEESVQELAAFIIQTIKTDFLLHPYMIDLLERLDEKADESNNLKILMPFIAKYLMNFLGQSKANCSFVYNLFKKGHILLRDIINIIKKPDFNISLNASNENIYSWFLPELIDNHIFNENVIFFSNTTPYPGSTFAINTSISNLNYPGQFQSFIKLYYPNKIDLYKQMRDEGEPDNELTKALRHDDVDKVQSILSRNISDISKSTVPFNIYEDFIPNGTTKYINYAAAYGSIKCFKYLLLNHQNIDENTFKFAVFGGNIEIIKIVDQTPIDKIETISNPPLPQMFNQAPTQALNTNSDFKNGMIIIPSIRKHENKIFDWIIENKIKEEDKSTILLQELITQSAENGNVHSLISTIDSGYNINDNVNTIKIIIQVASQNGFYKFSQFLNNILEKKNPSNNQFAFSSETMYSTQPVFGVGLSSSFTSSSLVPLNIENFAQFGNLDIFKFGKSICTNISSMDLERALSTAVKKNYMPIIKYIFNEISDKKFSISSGGIVNALINSLLTSSCELFDYLMEQFKTTIPVLFNNFKDYNSILPTACSSGNFEAAKKIIDLILKLNAKNDFTSSFIRAASSGSLEICKYFIEKKLSLNFETLSNNTFDLGSLNKELFSLVAENAPPYSRFKFYVRSLSPAIRKRNQELIEFLLNKEIPYENTLFDAVNTHDVEIVNIVLKYHSSPSFINKKTENGSALYIATKNNYIPIVQRLLSFPEIEVNSYDQRNLRIINHIIESNKHEMLLLYLKTGKIDTNVYSSNNGNSLLMSAIDYGNIEIAKALIDYQKTDINAQNYQGQTALISATNRNFLDIIDLLINNDRFDPIESRLNHAFYISRNPASKQLASCKMLDVNYRNIPRNNNSTTIGFSNEPIDVFDTPLIHAADINNSDLIDIIINHPSFDKGKSGLDQAINISIKRDNNEIFKKLIDIKDININTFQYRNTKLFKLVLDNRSGKIFSNLLDNPNFKPNKDEIQMAFSQIYTFNNDSISQLLTKLCNYAKDRKDIIDFKKCLPNGKSFFTSIIRTNNIDIEGIVNLFLDCGVDPNSPDSFNVYPLEHAISMNYYEYVVALLNSEKIDYTQKIPTIKSKSIFAFGSGNATSRTWGSGSTAGTWGSGSVAGIEKPVFNLNLNLPTNVSNDQANDTKTSNNNSKSTLNKKTSTLKQPFKFKTYFHLAAASPNSSILTEFLSKKVIDINVEDDQGNTPLMEACKIKQKENIEILLTDDGIDYLHKNQNGDDALSIMRKNSFSTGGHNSQESKENLIDKDEYCKKLLSFFAQNSSFGSFGQPFNNNNMNNINNNNILNFGNNNNNNINNYDAFNFGNNNNQKPAFNFGSLAVIQKSNDKKDENESKKDENESKKDENENKKDENENKKDENENKKDDGNMKDREKEVESTKINWKSIQSEVENAVLGIFADATPKEILGLKKSLSAIAERNENGAKKDDKEKEIEINEDQHQQKQEKEEYEKLERDYQFYTECLDDKADEEYLISQYEIQHNNMIQQQWQNIMQIDFIRQVNFERQMMRQTEFLQSLQDQTKKRKKKRRSHK